VFSERDLDLEARLVPQVSVSHRRKRPSEPTERVRGGASGALRALEGGDASEELWAGVAGFVSTRWSIPVSLFHIDQAEEGASPLAFVEIASSS
jgi:hypothetical protein